MYNSITFKQEAARVLPVLLETTSTTAKGVLIFLTIGINHLNLRLPLQVFLEDPSIISASTSHSIVQVYPVTDPKEWLVFKRFKPPQKNGWKPHWKSHPLFKILIGGLKLYLYLKLNLPQWILWPWNISIPIRKPFLLCTSSKSSLFGPGHEPQGLAKKLNTMAH